MSAWIVSQNHIRLLVEALYKYEVVPNNTTPDHIGRVLWRENFRSVNYRYEEHNLLPPFTHDSEARASWMFPSPDQGIIRDLVRNTALLYKQICCYNYQSCQHPGWESTQAYALMAALRKAVEKHGQPDYDTTAPWGID